MDHHTHIRNGRDQFRGMGIGFRHRNKHFIHQLIPQILQNRIPGCNHGYIGNDLPNGIRVQQAQALDQSAGDTVLPVSFNDPLCPIRGGNKENCCTDNVLFPVQDVFLPRKSGNIADNSIVN